MHVFKIFVDLVIYEAIIQWEKFTTAITWMYYEELKFEVNKLDKNHLFLLYLGLTHNVYTLHMNTMKVNTSFGSINEYLKSSMQQLS